MPAEAVEQLGASRLGSFSRIWPYAAGAALGFMLGSLAPSAFAALEQGSPIASAVRVGLALQARSQPPLAGLKTDLRTVRASLALPQRDVFDLVVAVNGLESGGKAQWELAERACRALRWPNCGRAALEQLRKQASP